MPDYRPISREALCDGNQWRAIVEVIDGNSRRQAEAQVDLNSIDGTPQPRIQMSDGEWIDVSPSFVSAFWALPQATASANDQIQMCREAPAAPRLPIQLTGIIDMLGGSNLMHPGRTFPAWSGAFYNSDTYLNPNVEMMLVWRPARTFTATLDVGGGPNFVATQSTGVLKHGYPFDIPQFFLEYCPNVLCIGTGRRADRSGVEGPQTTGREFALPSVNYSISPFFQFVYGELGLVGEHVAARAAVGPGPDRFFPDNNAVPYGLFNFSVTYPNFSLSADWQGGPDQDRDNSRWQHFVDLGLTFGAASSVRGTLYGMYGTADMPTGRQNWGGANAYLRVRPSGSPVAINLRTGYTHDDGYRTGLPSPVDLVQASAGLTFYTPDDAVQFRLQGDVIGAVDGSRPFFGENVLPRLMFQVVYNGVTDFGVSSPR
jgi:hypothetical protein